jgi:hypothetical protein
VTFDDRSGEIHLPSGGCVLAASASGELLLTVTAVDKEKLETIERVIGGHLERFGSKGELAVSWSGG